MPDVEKVKYNVDAGFNINRITTNHGWCVRDNLSRFVYAGVAWDFCLHYVLEAEALDLKEATDRAITLPLENVIFESDSQRVIQTIRSNNNGFFEFSLIIQFI